jgi:hypothetical protein
MDVREIARRRMHGQHLWGPPLESLEDVVRWLGALQAQEFAVAKWSVAQRAAGVDAAAMDEAFAEGAFLRTHLLRPTWHFVLPADIRWILQLTAPRVHALNAYGYRQLELDGPVLARSTGLIARALEGETHLTRRELAAMLEGSGIVAGGPRLAHVLMYAELEGVICSGPPRGKQQTYALLDERAPDAITLDRDEALAELTRRYFTARGPATLRDYLRWSSLTAADGKAGLDMVGSLLQQEVVGGRTYWFAASSPRPRALRANRVDLVQGYDEIVMSYGETKDVLFAWMAGKVTPSDRPVFLHAILLDGHLIGHWRPVGKGKQVVVDTLFYRPLDEDEERALDEALERYGQFVGTPVTLA